MSRPSVGLRARRARSARRARRQAWSVALRQPTGAQRDRRHRRPGHAPRDRPRARRNGRSAPRPDVAVDRVPPREPGAVRHPSPAGRARRVRVAPRHDRGRAGPGAPRVRCARRPPRAGRNAIRRGAPPRRVRRRPSPTPPCRRSGSTWRRCTPPGSRTGDCRRTRWCSEPMGRSSSTSPPRPPPPDNRRAGADVAELLAATAALVGVDRAVAAAAPVGDEALAASLPLLQPAALTAASRDALDAADVDEHPHDAPRRDRGAASTEVPDLEKLAARRA